jgi:hypothetical protein
MDAFSEIKMARTNLASMSVDALLTLRDDIGRVLSQKAMQLQDQLSRLGGESGYPSRGRRSSLKGRKVAIKYRDRSGNTWAGRGAQPVWLREKLKAGAKLEDFAVQKTVASRKASLRKSRKRRRAKRWSKNGFLTAMVAAATRSPAWWPRNSPQLTLAHRYPILAFRIDEFLRLALLFLRTKLARLCCVLIPHSIELMGDGQIKALPRELVARVGLLMKETHVLHPGSRDAALVHW